ncbi:MAG: O-antigen ligase family protein [Candidatus Omnitrophota bacterium]|jgi:putative inorganic carbon (HCO3(-)) transporter
MLYCILKIKASQSLKPIALPILLFCLSLIISVAFSLVKLNSIAELSKYTSGILILFLAATFTSRQKSLCIHAMVIFALIVSLAAMYQYFFGYLNLLHYVRMHGIKAPYIIETLNQNRAYFPFVSPNMLGGYVGMFIPLTLINPKKSWYMIPLVLTLLLTRSFGAIASTFLGLCLYIVLQIKDRKIVMALLGSLLLILGIVAIMRTTTAKVHIQPIFSTLARMNYWKETFTIIFKAPFTGIGIGNFNLPQTRFAHNSYLQIWAEMGITGLLAFIWLVAGSCKKAMGSIRLSRENQRTTIAVLSCVSVFLIHNLIDFTFFLPEVAMAWWLLLGISINDEDSHSHTDI